MSTTTIDDQLAEIRRRIDRLQAFAQADAAADELANPPPRRRAAPGGGIGPGRGPRLPTSSRRSSGS